MPKGRGRTRPRRGRASWGGALVTVIHHHDGLLRGEVLLEVGAGHAVGVQGGVKVRHDIAPEVEGAAHLPVLDALHGGGDAPEDAEPVAGQGVAPALQVGQLQAEGPGRSPSGWRWASAGWGTPTRQTAGPCNTE